MNKLNSLLDWRRSAGTFLSGLIVVLPLMVTLTIVMWIISSAETLLGSFIKVLIPNEAYLPGMGLILTLVLIFTVGILMQAIYFRRILHWLEQLLEHIPLIKTVYNAVKDLTGFFSRTGANNRRFGQVVQVHLPELPVRMIGFVTLEDLDQAGLNDQTINEDCVAVYFPMSYQIGGYTLLLPRSYLKLLDMNMEEAMRFMITAGMSSRPEQTEGGKNSVT